MSRFPVLLLGLASQLGYARELGQFANANPELRAWFNALKSGNGHYRVRIDGEWVNLPDEAVITEPNRVGRTMVWPIRDGVGGLYIRCFMPGSMT